MFFHQDLDWMFFIRIWTGCSFLSGFGLDIFSSGFGLDVLKNKGKMHCSKKRSLTLNWVKRISKRFLFSRIIMIIYNYFTGKVKGILLHQGFPTSPILFIKHAERSEGYFVGKVGQGNPSLRKIIISRKISSSFEMKIREFFPKTSQNGWLFYIIVPRNIK